MKQCKRIMAVILSTAVAFSMMCPAFESFAEDDNETSVNVKKIFDQDIPADFKTKSDPFGLKGNESTTVATFNELCMQFYHGGEPDDDGKLGFNWMNDFDTSKLSANTKASPYFSGTMFEGWTESDGTVSRFGYDTNHLSKYWRYSEGVSFDADGNGTDESVAYYGWDGGNLWATYYYMVKGKRYESERLKLTAEWGGSDNGIGDVDSVYGAQSFFSITSGDYNGDGVDTIFLVAYASKDSRCTPILYELKANLETKKLEVVSGGNKEYDGWVNPAYKKDNMSKDHDARYLLSVQLTTGDFNGDGVDDLATVSYTNDIKDYNERTSIDLYVPWLTYGIGEKTTSTEDGGVSTTPTKQVKVVNNRSIPIACGITSGDINGDRNDEIVIAGFKDEVEENNGAYSHDCTDADKDMQIMVSYSADENDASRILWSELDSNGWAAGHEWFGNDAGDDTTFQVVGVQTAALDGVGGPESIFLDGSIYKLTTDVQSGTKYKCVYTPSYFKESDSGLGSNAISVTYINDVVSGSFDEDNPGAEQFATLIGLKKRSSETYYFVPMIIGKQEVEAGSSSDGYYSMDFDKTQVITPGDRKVVHFFSIDCDDDSLTLRLNGKTCVYSDPNVVGVLQAAPFFDLLGTYDDYFDNGDTSIEFEESYETSRGESFGYNIGGGTQGSVETKHTETTWQLGYSHGFEESTYYSNETSSSYSISAGLADKVIIKRTPVYSYLYDTYNQTTGEWEDGGYVLNVSQQPKIYSLTIEEYNDFVDYYNGILNTIGTEEAKENKLGKIDTSDTSPLGKEGDPCSYRHVILGSKVLPLGYGSGSASISYSESSSKEQSRTTSNGLSFEVSLSGKIGFSDTVAAKIGGYFGSEFEWAVEESTTTTAGNTKSGTVHDLNAKQLAQDLGMTIGEVKMYGFDWSFGVWDINLGAAGAVPVYGYGLTNVTTAYSKIETPDAFLNYLKQITICWEDDAIIKKPLKLVSANAGTSTKDETILGYNVYMAEEGSEDYVKLNDKPLTEKSYQVSEGDYPKDKNLKFKVAKVTTGTDGKVVLAAMPSEEKLYKAGSSNDIGDRNIELVSSCKYNGKEQKPVVNILGLTEGEDYTLKYENNIEIGTATVTITGKGIFTGSVTKEFEITHGSIGTVATLSKTSYVYSGKANKPAVEIKDLKSGTDYTVAYSNNTKCGKATVKIEGIGNYSGTITKTFTIVPSKATISKATAGKKKITVSIKSQKTSGVSGYQVYYKKSGSSAKTCYTTSTSKTLSGLTKGKKYTVKVRAYKTIDGKKVYGAYSTDKTVKVK